MGESITNIKRKEYMHKFNEAGMRAVRAKGTEAFEKEIELLINCVKSNYFKYLLTREGWSDEKLQKQFEYERKHRPQTLDAYQKSYDGLLSGMAALKEKIDNIQKIVENFDEAKCNSDEFGFIIYMDKNFDYFRKAQMKESYFRDKREGLDVNRKTKELIPKIIVFLGDVAEENFTEDLVLKFAKKNNLPEEEVRKAWEENKGYNSISIDQTYTDDGDVIGMEIPDEDFAEKMFKTGELELAIKILNMVYHKDFTKDQKKIYPYIFSNSMIEEVIKDAKLLKKAKSLAEVVREYWEFVDLPYYRDTYAIEENKCVLRPEFDFTIENRIWKKNVDIAKHFGVVKGYITKVNNKVIKLVRKYMSMLEEEL